MNNCFASSVKDNSCPNDQINNSSVNDVNSPSNDHLNRALDVRVNIQSIDEVNNTADVEVKTTPDNEENVQSSDRSSMQFDISSDEVEPFSFEEDRRRAKQLFNLMLQNY
jgi:hypothetical protein